MRYLENLGRELEQIVVVERDYGLTFLLAFNAVYWITCAACLIVTSF